MALIMKVILLVIIISFLLGKNCMNSWSQNDMATVAHTQPDTMLKVTFKENIQPILKTHCSPCHFEGGKMYEKLPFDQPSTLINHSEGILKRIKDSTEVRKIKDFLETAEIEKTH